MKCPCMLTLKFHSGSESLQAVVNQRSSCQECVSLLWLSSPCMSSNNQCPAQRIDIHELLGHETEMRIQQTSLWRQVSSDRALACMCTACHTVLQHKGLFERQIHKARHHNGHDKNLDQMNRSLSLRVLACTYTGRGTPGAPTATNLRIVPVKHPGPLVVKSMAGHSKVRNPEARKTADVQPCHM